MEETQTSNKKYAIIAIISIAVLLSLFAAGYFLIKYYKGKNAPVENVEVYKPKIVTGTLLLSVLPKTISDGAPLTVSVDIASSTMSYIYDDVLKSDKLYLTQTSLSPNKQFFITGGIPATDIASGAVNLYSGRYNGTFKNIKPENIVAKFGVASDSTGLMYRTPSVGDHGGVLFSSAPKGTKNINYNWEIHYSAAGRDMVVAYGLYPKWVSSSEFVYVTKKAIRMHNLVSGKDSTVDTVIDNKGNVFPIQENMSLGVSKDGKQIAFTSPEAATVFLFAREGESFVLKKTFSAYGFWPTFSPDGKILALQSVTDTQNIKNNPNPRINFYDIETENPILLDKYVELGNFRNDFLFINDWY